MPSLVNSAAMKDRMEIGWDGLMAELSAPDSVVGAVEEVLERIDLVNCAGLPKR
jgi:hypothetical protein